MDVEKRKRKCVAVCFEKASEQKGGEGEGEEGFVVCVNFGFFGFGWLFFQIPRRHQDSYRHHEKDFVCVNVDRWLWICQGLSVFRHTNHPCLFA